MPKSEIARFTDCEQMKEYIFGPFRIGHANCNFIGRNNSECFGLVTFILISLVGNKLFHWWEISYLLFDRNNNNKKNQIEDYFIVIELS